MCITFWYQNDGTPNELMVGEAGDDPGASLLAPAALDVDGANTPSQDLSGEAGLQAASNFRTSFDDSDNITESLLARYKLILAFNRDENLERPTEKMDLWDEPSEIFAGKDKAGGGTWLGVSRTNARLTCVLNLWKKGHEKKEGQKSRGDLVTSSLRDFKAFSASLKKDVNDKKYAPFFLLTFDLKGPLKGTYYSCDETGALTENGVTGSGFCSHSNSSLNNGWAKCDKGLTIFEHSVTSAMSNTMHKSEVYVNKEIKSEILKLMKNTRRYKDKKVSDHYRGVLPEGSTEDESLYSAVCVKSKCDKFKYGTRTHTVVIVDKKNTVFIFEENAETGEEEFFRFQCE